MGEGVAPWNSLPMLGGWYLKSDYPRLYYWYVSKLPLSEIGAATDDSTPNSIDQTKWNVGIAKFWVPNHGGWFYRALDPDGDIDDQNPNRLSNQQQQDDNKDHNHVAYPWNRGSARASEVDNTNTPGSIDSNNPTTEYRVGGMSVDNWEAARIKSQGTQSRPKNLAVMPYVII